MYDTTDCWPTAASGAAAPSTPLGGWGFYSPGFDCPYGYTSACSATGGVSTGWPIQFSLLPDETAVGCCPSGFACAFGYAQTCQSLVNNYATAVVGTCSNGATANVRDLTVPYALTGSSASSFQGAEVTQFQVFAPLIDIRWQSSDRSGAASDGASPASATNTERQQDSAGLSTGVKAGIGVGVAIGVMAILLGLFFFWRRSKKTPREPRGERIHEDKHEVEGNPVYELEEDRELPEAGHKNPPWHERHEVRGSDPQLAQLDT